MQSAIVLYGWLITRMQTIKYRILMIGLIAGIGLSLIYSGYHNLIDILGAVFFGCLLIILYSFFVHKSNNCITWSVIFLSTLLMMYIGCTFKIIEHLWMAYYALIGMSLSEKFFSRYPHTKDLQSKIVATILCFGFIFIIKAISTYNFIPFIQQAQWALISFCIPCLVFISSLTIHHIRARYGRA